MEAPKIKAVLYTSKTYKDGAHPIMIRLTQNRKLLILTPQILFPVSNELKTASNYRFSIWTPKVCFSIDAVELREIFDLKKARYFVFFNEHYLPYLSRGLQFVKTGQKIVEKYTEI
jgi:hypothetical protein